MKRAFKIIGFLQLLLCGSVAFSQAISNRGKEFWVGYGHHQFMESGTNTQNMVLYLSAEDQPATVTVTIDSSGFVPATWWRKTYTIPAYTVIQSDIIPKGVINAAASGSDPNFDARLYTDPPPAGTGGAGIFRKKGIHIESNVPIVAYAHIYGSASSGATMLLPVEAWGYSYTSLNSRQSYASNCYNWMYVIAAKDNTVIQITPSVLTRAQDKTGLAPNVTQTFTLMKGQIYQIIGANDAADANGNGGNASTGKELSGTTVKSLAAPGGECYPIAVFAGSSRTSNPASCGSGGGDNDNQQMFPQHAWGRRYLTAPYSSGAGVTSYATSTFKVAVKDPTTVVRRNGNILTGLINNNYYTYESNSADYLESDKPITVVQFMTGGGCMPGSIGDPSMCVLSPIEQGIKRTGFYKNTKEGITQNFITLIVPTAGLPSLRIDNSSSFDAVYPHPRNSLTTGNYSVVVKRWSPASIGQAIAYCDSAFTAITYGLGSVESYAYNAGTNLINLNAIGDLHNVPDTTGGGKISHDFTCTNTDVKLSVLMRYQPLKLEWNLSSLCGTMTPCTNFTMDPASNYFVDSILKDGIKYYRYTLPGTYNFSSPGTYNIKIVSSSLTLDNCNNKEDLTITIIVKEKPRAGFTFTHTGCTKDTIYYTGPTKSLSGTYDIKQWKWTLGGGLADSVQNPKQVLPPGTNYTAKLYLVSGEGCDFDTTIPIKPVYAVPTAKIGASAEYVCVGSSIVFSDTSFYGGTNPTINKWYWDFNNGRIVDTTNGNPISILYPVGDYTVKHVVRVSPLCVSDTAVKIIKVSPGALVAIGYPTGCLPPSGVAQFTAPATDLGNQAIVSYSWDFGDANANAGNPNTSTAQNPTHTYTVNGTYAVKLSVVTASGCTGDTTVNIVMNVAPVLAYAPLSAVCANVAPLSVANGSVTNGVPGNGKYKGPGTDTAGMFNPAVAGVGTHTIWYVFTSTGGCKDSVSQTIKVNAKPKVWFGYPKNTCLPGTGLAQLSDSTTISDGQTLSYAWNFGDANANAGNPNTSTLQNPAHNFQEGNYSIKLTVTSANGCIGDSTIVATFKVTPVLAYPALAPICQNNAGTVNIATASVTNGVTGTGIYKGPGTSTTGSFDPGVAGSGTHTIWYVFTTTGGCKDSISQTIAVAAKPVANFTFPTGSCLPSNGQVQFTNASTVSGGGTLTYKWKFNDANATAGNPDTSILQDPTHIFKEGTYNIKLTATSNSGCSADTTISATFKITPALNYPALAPFCQSGGGTVSVATANVTNGVTGNGVYKGPGTDATGNFNSSIAGAGTHTIWYVFTTTGGCKDSVSQTITVSAKPNASFSFPTGSCLPITGQVQFTNGSTISNGQTLSYSWNFGDANANAGNPNTSTQTNPSHIFQEGNYVIKLTATSQDGCVDDSIINATFKISPALTFGPLSSFCESATSSVSVANASVVNGVTGTGIYKGPGTNAAGNMNTAIAGPGTHTIWYVFTTTGGCIDSVSRNITIKATPKASFTTSGGCLPQNGLVQFTNTSTISNGETLSYLWNFGDANANAGNPNTSTLANPTHNFINGTYTIKLTVTSGTGGCVKDTSITATFSVSPQLAFQPLTAVCASQVGTVSVATGSVLNSVPGNGIYKGPGTDTLGNFSPSVAGAGTHTIWYVYTSTAGCKDSLSRNIVVHPKPTPLFSVSSNAICADKSVVITNQSSANSVGFAWNFGDGTTATTAGPFTKSYNSIDSFTISLAVVSDMGCTNDPYTQKVKVNPLPTASFQMPASICMVNGQGVAQFTNQSSINGGGVLNYTWNFGDGSPADNATSPTHTFNSTGPFSVNLLVTSAQGCVKDTTRVLSAFYDRPSAGILVDRDTLCQGTPSIFTNVSSAPNSTIQSQVWKFGDGTTSTAVNPAKTYQLPGNYRVSLAVKSAQGCTDTGYYNVRVYLQPVIDAGPSFTVPQGTMVKFNPTVNDSALLTFEWDPGFELSAPDSLRPSLVATNDRVYTLTATGLGQCVASDTLSVKVLLPIAAVNAFSPNGDGINDTWEIPNLKDYPGATVEVFNRYGQTVFKSNGYNRPWDGTYNGKPLPVGVYYYIVQLKNGFPQVSGSVTILK